MILESSSPHFTHIEVEEDLEQAVKVCLESGCGNVSSQIPIILKCNEMSLLI